MGEPNNDGFVIHWKNGTISRANYACSIADVFAGAWGIYTNAKVNGMHRELGEFKDVNELARSITITYNGEPVEIKFADSVECPHCREKIDHLVIAQEIRVINYDYLTMTALEDRCGKSLVVEDFTPDESELDDADSDVASVEYRCPKCKKPITDNGDSAGDFLFGKEYGIPVEPEDNNEDDDNCDGSCITERDEG